MSGQPESDATPGQRPSWTGRKPETLRGLLVNGRWHCDCEPRRIASHFETKNGGKNHGRWFYTCPKPREMRCGFFLWDDIAKEREAPQITVDAEAGNTVAQEVEPVQVRPDNTKPGPVLRTPKANRIRESIRGGLLTPESQTKRKRDASMTDYLYQYQSPTKKGKLELPTSPATEDTSSFTTVADISYPSLASRLEALDAEPIPPPPMFVTPKKSTPPPKSETCPAQKTSLEAPTTPTPSRFTSSPLFYHSAERINKKSRYCETTAKALGILEAHKINITPKAKEELTELLDRHDLKTLGIIKGRDISRLAIKSREKRIEALESRISILEAERESWKTLSMNKGYHPPSGTRKDNDELGKAL
ncbi:hypothetical protein TESG_03638 [Trichophyton tonsurans CBS 112818]|uniref:GRF-type domain-containing protein n=2 Tax=Trichophyton TaxID=5550 RepID=F2PGF2_TRIEC|nr:hypothetical protein TESG_03638 [Trichophyton tonsurans CBS 112818]EGE00970.1 hypothetical protein TEQG_00025 [Trichophyton equinum CBS 127.97]